MLKLSDTIERKFTDSFDIDEWEIETDTGWQDISSIHKTVPYTVWEIKTESGKSLKAADTHILFDGEMNEIFVKDCIPGFTIIMTKDGPEQVSNLYELDYSEPMYDVSVPNGERFYSSDILSHNTVSSASYLLWYGLFHESKTIGILANLGDMAREILSRIKMAFEQLPAWLQQGVAGDWNKGRIQFENGSKFVAFATSGDAARGYSFSYLYIDECAIIEHGIWENFYKSTYPTVSSGTETKITLVSTPKGLNHFYKLWTEAEEKINSYKTFDVHWADVPGRNKAWKEKTLADIGQEAFQQEYETEFLGSSNTLILGSRLRELAFKKPAHEKHGLAVYEGPIVNHTYIITVDTARGKGQDYSAFIVSDVTEIPYKMVARFRSNDIPVFRYPDVIHRVAVDYNEAMVLIEVNDIGQQVADILNQDFEYENVMMSSMKGRTGQVLGAGFAASSRPGITMSKAVKRVGCYNLKDLIEDKKYLLNDADTITELSVFVSKGQSFEAEEGYHDDLVMCLVMLAWVVSQKYFREYMDQNIAARIATEKMNALMEDMTPFGIIDDGTVSGETFIDNSGTIWNVSDPDPEMYPDTFRNF